MGTISDVAAGAKARGGLVFSALTTVFASLVLPEIAKRTTKSAERIELREIAFRAAFFALMGILVDLLYRGLAGVFGDSANWDVVARKLAVDQLLFSPFVAIPLAVLAFLWRDYGFRVGATRDAIRKGEFLARYVPVIITCWCFWLPTLVAVFAMPARLQFILFLFAQGAWSILLIHMSDQGQ